MSGVAADVLDDSMEVFGVADDAVVGFLFPQVAGLFEFGGDVPGGDGFHAADQVWIARVLRRAGRR